MEFIDLIVRNQLLLFELLASAVVALLYLGRRWLLGLRITVPTGSGTLGGTGVSSITFSARDLLNQMSVTQIILTLFAIFLAITAIGFFEPVSKATALPLPPASRDLPSNKSLIVFVHGWDGDPRATWQVFPELVQRDETFDSFNVIAISYPSFYARRNLGMRAMARWLNERFERERIYERYENIWLLTHSMGGLIARELLIANRLRRDNGAYRILVEIATPHQGASIAALAKALGVSSGFVDELFPGSPFLSNLREDWNALKDRPKTYCLTSPHDSVVTAESAIAQCDEYLRYPQWDHIDMVKPIDQKDERYAVPMSRVKATWTPSHGGVGGEDREAFPY